MFSVWRLYLLSHRGLIIYVLGILLHLIMLGGSLRCLEIVVIEVLAELTFAVLCAFLSLLKAFTIVLFAM